MRRAWAGIGRGLPALAGVLLIWGVAAGACAAEKPLAAAGRAVLAKYQDALVTVRLTAKVHRVYQGQEHAGRETTSEVSGTVLTPSGLTVFSAASGDPSGASTSRSAGSETDFTDTKIVLRDGRELPARFVLRDRDLDLAFVMPEEQGLSLPYVAFDAGATLAPLDDVVFIYPLGKAHGREPAVALGMVQAVLTKPRRLMAVDLVTGLRSMGCPAFSATGQIVGLVVLKPASEQSGGADGLRGTLDMLQPVIVPAETVRDLAKQATAKPATP